MVNDPPVPPSARALLDAVGVGPTRMMVFGGIGAGKTATLAAARRVLRTQGIEVRARPSTAGPDGTALVVDDAHLLGDAELIALRTALSGPTPTILVAAEPHQQRAALHDLVIDLGRENPTISLTPLSESDIDAALSAARDTPPARDALRTVLAATSGLPFLVAAVLKSIDPQNNRSPVANIADTVRNALLGRLRQLDAALLDVLLLASLTPDLGPADIATALNLTAGDAATLVDRVRAGGLADPAHSAIFLQAVHAATVQLTGITRHAEVEAGLLRSQLESATLTTDLALRLVEHGLRGREVADILAGQARKSAGAPAVRLYRAAVDAGAHQLAPQLAEALVGSGDCAAGAAAADGLLDSPDPVERAVAVRVTASIAGHDGNAAEAAALVSWLGPPPDAVSAAAGTIAQLAVGNLAAARTAAGVDDDGPPTAGNRAARRLTAGLLATIDQPYPVAMAALSRAAPTAVLPDSPAALAGLVALHGGDPGRARTLLDRAGTSDPLFGHRHRLLRGWLKMQDGQLRAAAAETAGSGTLHRRDALWSAALQTAIARRSGDSGALHQHWSAAMDVLTEYSVDLFSLLPLGELWVAAARLHQVDRVRHAVDQGFAVLATLGNPALWSVPLHWAGVHAGILAGEPDAVAPHGQALTAAGTPLALALAGAGRAWLRILAGQVEAEEVAVAARTLARFGLTGDATRLVSQGALQTPDARVAGAMLALARDLKVSSPADEPPPPGTPAPTAAAPGRAALSEREREVAELVLLGLPYRDIGKQLFISAKTVEHHVARIRRRLGAESRAEMLSMLRAMLAT